MRAYLNRLVQRETLRKEEARLLMDALVTEDWDPAQVGALFGLLRGRGETAEEIAGFAESLRARARSVSAPEDAVDTAGTGGDGARTYNVSTAAALLAASAGIPVVKHGNRAVSSRSGSADVLEALGIPVGLEPEEAAIEMRTRGFAFLFAPTYHPALGRLQGVRRSLGIPTVMNLLGPLVNPAHVRRQVLGVADRSYQLTIARSLLSLGVKRALVVSSDDGLDELSVSGVTRVVEIKDDALLTYDLTPQALGLPLFPQGSYSAGEAKDNAEIIRSLFFSHGEEMNADLALLLANAGATFYVAGRVDSLKEGVRLAGETLSAGRAAAFLESYEKVTVRAASQSARDVQGEQEVSQIREDKN
ncbi:MAG: anthranilate phosphoribosyltransferase [Candidatus Carbobacillus altaicus]|uniref:Anthranilate phosphoribosyltransferase n=1 Tax=Candidatus Carbonibacillus altaicus TaxID=2163959 RepID=A0A2R6Y1V2_9BACL|nr:anthranilate phosphoribosyltransferase [Candidatus Carbobacillus altaicus]PTQ56615.1 MAG: Anthranilate phosphoribosyltransferase [Candidatus Carbobacillus altaicus]